MCPTSVLYGVRDDVAYLRQRYEQMKALPAFAAMEWSRDEAELASWIPLVMAGRDPQMAVAATRIERGTDVDFGALSRAPCLFPCKHRGPLIWCSAPRFLISIAAQRGGSCNCAAPLRRRVVTTPFVFLGAGGGALPLLQRSRYS